MRANRFNLGMLVIPVLLFAANTFATPKSDAYEIVDRIEEKLEYASASEVIASLAHLRSALAALNNGAVGGMVITKIADTESTFGCAVGWRNLRIERFGRQVFLKADNLKSDYVWSGTPVSSSASLPYHPNLSGQLLYIDYARGRDHLELKVEPNGNLIGRCKSWQTWFLVEQNVLKTNGHF